VIGISLPLPALGEEGLTDPTRRSRRPWLERRDDDVAPRIDVLGDHPDPELKHTLGDPLGRYGRYFARITSITWDGGWREENG
jgi:hypothetical protein